MRPGRRTGAGEHGFSLPELVMILVILGVLSAFAVPRFFDRGAAQARGYFDETLAAVRFAHKLAMASGCDVQVSVGAGGYALARRASCTSGAFSAPIPHPARSGAFAAGPPGGVSMSGSAVLHFDPFGRPRTGAGTPVASAVDVSIGGRILRIEPETGFAHAP